MRTALCLLLLLGGLGAWSATVPAQEQDQGDPTQVERFTDGDADHGADLYKRYCSGCHGADGRGGAHTFMPHVQNLTEKDYIELVPDGYLYQVIAEGGAAVGKNTYMPAWESTLSEQDIKDIIAHIRALPTY
jgi:mono/diheme cytochrome c family protein